MVHSVMAKFACCGQVILLCDSWYPKKPVTGLVTEFKNLEMICCVRSDTVLYDLPGERTGKRGRPRIQTCISYAAMRLLPYYSREFEKYQGESPQEMRYELEAKIRMNIIIHSLGQTIETIKKDIPLKKAFHELMRKCGYL